MMEKDDDYDKMMKMVRIRMTRRIRMKRINDVDYYYYD